MTCRHEKGDPNCSSHPSHPDNPANQRYDELLRAQQKAAAAMPPTPDASAFAIEDARDIGPHLVLKVRYPNCAKCAYEGNKVMVYLNVSPLQALRWKKIDPHFRAPRGSENEAPSPAARFPASPTGWSDAIAYAASKAEL